MLPKDVANYPLHINPKDGTSHFPLSDHVSFGPVYREVLTSVYSSNYILNSSQLSLINSLKGSVYQKIQSLKDEEVANYLREVYKEIEKRSDENVLEDLINLDRNIELYNKLDEIDYKISQKEQKAYRDLRWFERKG